MLYPHVVTTDCVTSLRRMCEHAVGVFVAADRVVFGDKDIGVSTTLSVNGRLFISPYEHLDALV